VSAAFTELGLGEEWPGQGNREADTWPVLQLRESAQKLGLIRKRNGELLQTARGRAAVDDPVALWWHLAGRLPIPSGESFESQAGLLILVAISAGPVDGVDATVAEILGAIGWMLPDGAAPTPWHAVSAAGDTYEVLWRIGAMAGERFSGRSQGPTVEGTLFARAALTTWPK
jgi:hypothetical protein